jgi:hypothetical protein
LEGRVGVGEEICVLCCFIGPVHVLLGTFLVIKEFEVTKKCNISPAPFDHLQYISVFGVAFPLNI